MVACILGTTRSAFAIRSRHVSLRSFLMGNGADRVDVLLDIARNQLAVATHTSLQVDKVVRVADGANALGDCSRCSREALMLLASSFHLPAGPAPDSGPPWGDDRAARCGGCVVAAGCALAHA